MSTTINAETKLNGDEDPSLDVEEDDDVEEVGETGATGTPNTLCSVPDLTMDCPLQERRRRRKRRKSQKRRNLNSQTLRVLACPSSSLTVYMQRVRSSLTKMSACMSFLRVAGDKVNSFCQAIHGARRRKRSGTTRGWQMRIRKRRIRAFAALQRFTVRFDNMRGDIFDPV